MKSLLISLALVSLALAAEIRHKPQVKTALFPDKATKQNQQTLTCYEYYNGAGSSTILRDYTPNLANYNFDNRISYCCFNGIWILYDYPNYNYNDFNKPVYSAWGEGTSKCVNFDANTNMDNKASSARFVGAPDGFRYDTINLYQGHYYMGDEQYSYQDVDLIKNDHRSAIITGCSPWSVYPGTNFQGSCTCMWPADTSACNPGYFPDLSNSQANRIGSARRGCFNCPYNLYPSNYMERSSLGVAQDESYFPGK